MDFKTKLDKKEDKAFSLTVTVPAQEVKKEYDDCLKKQAKTADVKGFRKGKAPSKLVEEKIDKEELDKLVLEEVIRKAYPEAVKELDLKPVIPPEVKLVSTKKGKDWVIEFVSAEMPEIDLTGIKEKIKAVNAGSKIWTPEKGSEKKENDENKDKQVQKIIETIIKEVEISLPDIILDYELNRKLVNLVDQVNQAGLQLEQYLSTKGTSIEELKKTYRQEIANNWKIDLALENLADSENIEVTEKDTKKIDQSKMNPYLAAKIIRRQKTLEYLLNL